MNKYLIITDTHIGSHQHSLKWYEESVEEFLYHLMDQYGNQGYSLIHCGDLLEFRTTISIPLLHKIQTIFEDLCGFFKDVYMIAGNHDLYYSGDNQWSALDLIFPQKLNNLHIISTGSYFIEKDGVLLVPYRYDLGFKEFKSLLKTHKGARSIFTHCNPFSGTLPNKIKVFSGHMHTRLNMDGSYTTLGSTISMNWADANQTKYYYIWDPFKGALIEYPNTISPSYHRINNINQIKTFKKIDYIDLPQSPEDLSKNLEKIKDIQKEYPNLNVYVTSISEIDIKNPMEINTAPVLEEVIRNTLTGELWDRYVSVGGI